VSLAAVVEYVSRRIQHYFLRGSARLVGLSSVPHAGGRLGQFLCGEGH